MIGHRCRNCQWWDNVHPRVRMIPAELGIASPGICRKHRPAGQMIRQWYYGVQPVMDADEFCGEFRQDEVS